MRDSKTHRLKPDRSCESIRFWDGPILVDAEAQPTGKSGNLMNCAGLVQPCAGRPFTERDESGLTAVIEFLSAFTLF